MFPKVCPLSAEYITFRLSLPSPFQATYSRPFRDASAGLSGLVSPSVTLLISPDSVLPVICTCATFRLSFPSPFQAIYRLPLCAQRAGAHGLVSGDVSLLALSNARTCMRPVVSSITGVLVIPIGGGMCPLVVRPPATGWTIAESLLPPASAPRRTHLQGYSRSPRRADRVSHRCADRLESSNLPGAVVSLRAFLCRD